MSCYCGRSREYAKCCEPFIKGAKKPESAEQLMRARYSAYNVQDMEYIDRTHDPKTREDSDMEANREWAAKANWQGLDILTLEEGGAKDTKGMVEFVASYEMDGEDVEHHEEAEFVKKEGRWFFSRGRNANVETVVREGAKVGRNDPCPCGSGKQHTQCCGAH